MPQLLGRVAGFWLEGLQQFGYSMCCYQPPDPIVLEPSEPPVPKPDLTLAEKLVWLGLRWRLSRQSAQFQARERDGRAGPP